MTLAGHKVNLYYAFQAAEATWYAEDTFVEAAQVDFESHSPTGSLSPSPGIGGWSYNRDGVAPNLNNLVVNNFGSCGVGTAGVNSPMRSRSTNDVVGPEISFRAYTTTGRGSVCFGGVRSGLRILIDGTDADDSEKDGIDVYMASNDCTRGHLQVDEYVNGASVGSKSFYTDTTTNDMPFEDGVSDTYGIMVEFTPGAGAGGYGQLVITVGDGLSEGSYGPPANPVTLYTTGDVQNNTYDLATDRTGKKRLGIISAGQPAGTGYVQHVAAASGPAMFNELGRCTLAELEMGAPAFDAVSHDSAGYREHVGGVREWSLGTGFFLVDDSTSQLDMFNVLQDQTLLMWKVEPSTSGGTYFQGDGYVKRWSAQAPTDDGIKARLSVAGQGQLQQTTS